MYVHLDIKNNYFIFKLNYSKKNINQIQKSKKFLYLKINIKNTKYL